MQVNSINKQPNFQSFGKLIIHDKKIFAGFGIEYLEKQFNNPLMDKFAKSSEYDLHISYDNTTCYGWKWKIKSVGQGFRGFINNIQTSWERSWNFKEFNINRYLKKYHPTLEEIKKQKIQMKLLREEKIDEWIKHLEVRKKWLKEQKENEHRSIQETNEFFNNIEQKNNPQ